MAIRRYKPTSPGRRFQTVSAFEEITSTEPERSLLRSASKSGGRNNNGRITSRRRGGGHKRRYRLVDFKRLKDGVPARVASVEYDPNRSARVALLHYADGEKRYILAPGGLKVGESVMSGPQADIRPGNAMALSDMPLGMTIHNIELHPGKGGQLARSAGVLCSTHGARRQVCSIAAGIGRDASGAGHVQGHHRAGWQCRPRERFDRKSREVQVAGPPSQRARCCHEPG